MVYPRMAKAKTLAIFHNPTQQHIMLHMFGWKPKPNESRRIVYSGGFLDPIYCVTVGGVLMGRQFEYVVCFAEDSAFVGREQDFFRDWMANYVPLRLRPEHQHQFYQISQGRINHDTYGC